MIQKIDRLKDLDEVEIYELDLPPFKGFMVKGKGQHGPVTRVQLIDTARGLDVRFHFYGAGAADDRLIGSILNSLKVQ